MSVSSVGWDSGPRTSVSDISFSIPQRKKLKLEFNQSVGARAMNLAGGNSSEEFAVRWDSVWEVFCLPVPEKAQAQYNFCIFSQSSDGTTADQMLWTVPDAIPKEGTFNGAKAQEPESKYKTLLISALNDALKPYKKRVVEPSKDEFSSQIVQAHRKGETAFHVKAFRGSKDGFLFLLSTGIFWGFKKPLEFFAFDAIESLSYTSVLQRTFNLNIAIRTTSEASVQEYEFSMIDQADFAGIDEYVKRRGLQDASMAEQRRAKKLNVNGVKGKGGKGAAREVDDAEGELEKAAREAQDLEDEEEEDDENFDPGSEGESEGSGSSDEEDDEEDGGGQAGDMVDEEMSSEADEDEA